MNYYYFIYRKDDYGYVLKDHIVSYARFTGKVLLVPSEIDPCQYEAKYEYDTLSRTSDAEEMRNNMGSEMGVRYASIEDIYIDLKEAIVRALESLLYQKNHYRLRTDTYDVIKVDLKKYLKKHGKPNSAYFILEE